MNILSRILSTVFITLTLLLFANIEAFAQNGLFARGEHYFFNGKFAMAERFLLKALESDSENPLIYAYLGDILFSRNEYTEALKMYQIVDELKPSGQNYFRMGQVYYKMNNGRLAIANFRKTIEVDPGIKFAYYHIGLTYLIIFREKENAIAFWKKFIEISPEDPQIETIKEAVDILSSPSFILPPFGSAISVEQALRIGGYSPIEEVNPATLYRSAEPVRTFHEKMNDRAIRMEPQSAEAVNDSAKKNEERADRLLHQSTETQADTNNEMSPFLLEVPKRRLNNTDN